MRNTLLACLSDRWSVEVNFFLNHGYRLNLKDPKTFNEKLAHRKLFDRDPRMPSLVDKITAKSEVSAVLGPGWVTPTLWYGDRFPPRAERRWPIPYLIKGSQGSRMNIFVRSSSDENWPMIEATASKWLAQKYYGRYSREWIYSQIPPRLLVEPCIDIGAGTLVDYKFYTFAGRVAHVSVVTGLLEDRRQSLYDRDWNLLRTELVRPRNDVAIPRPVSLDRMIAGAERLGAPFPFVRVDFYEVNGEPRFGEMTFYPNGGSKRFRTPGIDAALGALWPIAAPRWS